MTRDRIIGIFCVLASLIMGTWWLANELGWAFMLELIGTVIYVVLAAALLLFGLFLIGYGGKRNADRD